MKIIKRITVNFLFWLTPRWLKEEISYRLFDEAQRDEELKHWYKARRAGFKKTEMGYYYSDLENGKHSDFLGNY